MAATRDQLKIIEGFKVARTKSINATIQSMINQLKPISLESLELKSEHGYTSIIYTTLNLRDRDDVSLFVGEQRLLEVLLCFPCKDNFNGVNKTYEKWHQFPGHYILLTLNDCIQAYQLPDEKFCHQAKELFYLFTKIKGTEEYGYEMTSPEKIDWKEDWQLPEAYRKLYDEAYRSSISVMHQLPEFTKSTVKKRYVSLGCTNGDDLFYMRSRLDLSQVAEMIGIDICESAIARAEFSDRKSGRNPSIKFICADASTLMRHVIPDEKTFTIGMANGYLTRQTASGSLQALPIMQQAFRCFNALVVMGATEPFFTLEVARAIGWLGSITRYNIPLDSVKNIGKNFYLFRKPTKQDVAHRLYQQGSFLDLSMVAEPMTVMKSFSTESISNVDSVDLSFAFIPEGEAKEVAAELTQFPQLKKIFHDPDDLFVGALKLLLPKCSFVSINRRKDFPDEVPPFTLCRELSVTNRWDRFKPKPESINQLTECKMAMFVDEKALADGRRMHALAVGEHENGNYEVAIKSFTDAIKIFKANNADLSCAKSLLALASSYRDSGQINKMMECLEECIRIYKKRGMDDNSHELQAVYVKLNSLSAVVGETMGARLECS